ncbi:MAG: methionyl-tRNA formyltransferase [Desulfobacterales bacterium]|jgi:methionyl-tRNA formyltransferase|nr:methionyl-tRNA formyltransferase [Desulfobacteraceae bacterium]MBT7086337.1 methionyl-tRNA formyltransferase [Desulfobacterales bacterium]MBT7696573.1 methionyl-tRNA formyltransferase [Desulfobacterales bacterium]
MKKISRIVFMGTPEFAVPALKALKESGYDVPLVVTQPDRPKGRGQKVYPPPVKEAAVSLGCNVLQPDNVKTEEFAAEIESIKPDLYVVVAFGHILNKRLLSIPGKGSINIHASLLPEYRGPAPIQHAIISGEKETGVTTILMGESIDSGDIILAAKEEIRPDDTSSTLHDRLAASGAKLLIKTLGQIESGNIKLIPQDHDRATYAPMLKKSDGHIDWNLSAESLDAFIRGMTPWPGAYTFHDDKRLKIFSGEAVETDIIDALPGKVMESFEGELIIATGKGALSILELQGSSGKRLKIRDFLRGNNIPAGIVFR